MRRNRTPSASQAAARASRPAASPETTTDAGPLTAATDTPVTPARRAVTSASGAAIDAIAPRPDRLVAMAWLRTATTRAPSCKDSAPDTTAAAISPWEWPTTAAGVTP